MKKIFFMAVAIALSLYSCTKDELSNNQEGFIKNEESLRIELGINRTGHKRSTINPRRDCRNTANNATDRVC